MNQIISSKNGTICTRVETKEHTADKYYYHIFVTQLHIRE